MTATSLLWIGRLEQGSHRAMHLSAAGFRVAVATSLLAARAELRDHPPELVVVEAGEGGAPALAILRELTQRAGAAKLIALVPGARDIVLALNAGAHEALPADLDDDLLRARAVAWARAAASERQRRGTVAALTSKAQELESQVSQSMIENERLRRLVQTDELTGLGNRRRFNVMLGQGLTFIDRYGGALGIVLCDLDGMKQLNDSSGHAAGDAALKRVAVVLRRALRGCDLAARLGGDEFGMLLPATGPAEAMVAAERVRLSIAALPLPGDTRITASFGVACALSGQGGAGTELIRRADEALYRAKRLGKDRVESADSGAARDAA